MSASKGLYEHEWFALLSEQAHTPERAEFVLACCARWGRSPPRDGVELACGLALDALELARRGVRMRAIDLSPAMVARARSRVGDAVAVTRADFARFVAPTPVDFVMNLGLNTSHLRSGDAMLRHLGNVAESLKRGGLYLFDVEHVLHRVIRGVVGRRGRWLVLQTEPAYFARGSARGRPFEIQFGDTTTELDPATLRFRSKNIVRVQTRGGVREKAFPSEGKLFTPEEIRHLVARVPGLELVAMLAAYDPRRSIENHPEADRFVVVLRKGAGSAPLPRSGRRG